MMRFMISGLALCCAFGAAAQQTNSAIDAAVKPVMTKYQLPGMAIAVLRDGKTHFYNYGVASKQSQTPVSEQTLFEIGSLSKTFTAALASYAVEQGKMDWRDPVSRRMPELKNSAFDRVTLLNLATHTSGLPLFVPDSVQDTPQLMAWYQAWRLPSPPGSRRVYSNLGIGLLGMISARQLELPFKQAMEQRLLPAMGMHHTWIEVPQDKMGDYAQGYNKEDQPVRVTPGPLDAESYGLKSSSADLIRWLAVNMGQQKVDNDWQKAVSATHHGYFHTRDFTQAMMWEYYPWPVSEEKLVAGNSGKRILNGMRASAITPPKVASASTWYNKTGSTNGFSTYAVFIPAENTAVIMLANKWFPNDDRVQLVREIIGQLTDK
jgi:beta-lactamase class C